MKKFSTIVLFLMLLVSAYSFAPQKAEAADFNPSMLISNADFINVNSMSAAAIQRFLDSKNSYLKGFSENGRTAAQIIYDAAHGYGDATGSVNGISLNSTTGTINPGAILVTLQKEQSLVTRATLDQTALDRAMGYACPDSGSCNANYLGFTKQVENGAWQLRYNYERSQGTGFSDYQVDQSFNFDGDTGTFSNRATAALYRYTPHVYNGNYNFWNLFHNTYRFSLPEYNATHSWQSGSITIAPGGSATVEVKFVNSGNATWLSSGPNRVSLAVDKFWADRTAWQGDGWISANRMVVASEGDISPGGTGTYSFQIKAPTSMPFGSHRFFARLVADGITWFENPDTNGGAWWNINVPRPSGAHAGQSASVTAWPGEVVNMSVTFTNNGSTAWSRTNPPTNLALDKYQDESFMSGFNHNWLSSNRIASLPTDTVAPGASTTFNFQIKLPNNLSPGNYRFYVRLVQDGFSWFEPDTNGGAWWNIYVPAPKAAWVSQSSNPTLSPGQSTNLSVTFRNTTGVEWQSSNKPVSLALDKYWTDQTAWQGTGWISQNRIASTSVANGTEVTYTFNIAAPWSMPSGRHKFYVRLVANGYSWFDNPDTNGAAWWEITVP